MKTLYLKKNEIEVASNILKNSGIVAVPTETVYGLAANTFDLEAIKKIFIAKGRPSDNPLIVHISNLKTLNEIASEFSLKAQKLVEYFWPGPLTIILQKKDCIPAEVTGNMDSVAIRFPSNKIIQNLINLAGFPLVAPSANLSGSPSPTNFNHVLEDLDGKIDAIIDGGKCQFGLESTVISFIDEVPKILRPGAITPLEIENVIGKINIDSSVFSKINLEEKVISPGVKYKHYAPKSKVILVDSSTDKYVEFLNSIENKNIMALCFEEDIKGLKVPYMSYGKQYDYFEQAKNLFEYLRKLDKLSPDIIYAHCCKKNDGMGIAVYNRLIRSAGFDIIRL